LRLQSLNSIDKQTHVDNSEEQLINTNNHIEDLRGQIIFSITIIKKPSAKRKNDELNEKTLTRQQRIVLGPPPFMGQTNGEYINWLNYQKHKLNIQHEQQHEQSSNIYDNFQLTTKQKATFDGKIDLYIYVMLLSIYIHIHAK